MKLSEDLTWRGFIGQTTYDDLNVLDGDPISFYWGVDPSADSMQIGNLAAAMLALRFIRAGHKGILLAGGATGMAGGDPDGKDETRAKIDLEILNHNIAGIKSQFERIFANENVEIVNNYGWFKNINSIDFLREIGWHFSMTQLLDRDFVQKRIGDGGRGLNFAEFSYSLIQGYDFLHLFREKDVTLQLCAVDQFGNSVSGMQLIRKLENTRADVFAMPLILNKSTGKKFGKSEGGAVWLSAEKTSPYQFYQFWLNVDDSGVIDYLKIYTFLDREQIEAIAADHAENPGQRLAQRTLAHEVTTLVHGRATTESVERVTRVLFGGADFGDLTDNDVANLAREIPTINYHSESANGHPESPDHNPESLNRHPELDSGSSKTELTVVTALTESGLATSKSDAQRLIKQNAISVNGAKIAADQTLTEKSLIKKGKNQFVLIR